MIGALTIRNAVPTEADLLTALANRSKAYWPYDPDYLQLCQTVTLITGQDIRAWPFRIAELNNQICGFAAVCPVKNEFMLDHLWIEPEFIGFGIGRRLFDDAVIQAKSMGWTKFTIAADPYAEKFYSRMGATRIDDRESKVRPGFFLPLMEFEIGLTLIGNVSVRSISEHESGDSLIDLAQLFPSLRFDLNRHHVQKKSKSISLARREIGERLMIAQSLLPDGRYLLIKECHRPMDIQREFWNGYFSHLQKKFPDWSDQRIYQECSKLNAPLDVAPHTTGGAVDLTLCDFSGEPVNMGTEFNADPLETNEATFTATSNISQEAQENRQSLMSVMSKAGFVNYPTEWWHWSYGDKYWAHQAGKPFSIFTSVEAP